MKLLIHDLNEFEWAKVADNYNGWEVISNNGNISPCGGCFGCWLKEPGRCVIKDGYENIAEMIHKADMVTIISRYSYGGFGSFIKTVVDRSIGYVLPLFEIYNDEMHHKPRYPEYKPVKFIFRANEFTEDDKVKARRYVESVCANFRAVIRDIVFEECDLQDDEKIEGIHFCNQGDPNRKLLLNCSLKGDKANSKKFLKHLANGIKGDREIVNLSQYVNDMDELAKIVAGAGVIVLGIPLYVDGIPSSTLRFMELVEELKITDDKKIYVVCNNGFYESQQNKNLISMVRTWCQRCGYKYCGSVSIGAGELTGPKIKAGAKGKGPAKNVASSLNRLAKAINADISAEDLLAEPNNVPRSLYMFMGNLGMRMTAKTNGVRRKDFYKRWD